MRKYAKTKAQTPPKIRIYTSSSVKTKNFKTRANFYNLLVSLQQRYEPILYFTCALRSSFAWRHWGIFSVFGLLGVLKLSFFVNRLYLNTAISCPVSHPITFIPGSSAWYDPSRARNVLLHDARFNLWHDLSFFCGCVRVCTRYTNSKLFFLYLVRICP